MSKDKKKDQKNVVFRRIHGRIIPISVGAAGAVGSGVALDAARTERIYQKAGVAIDRKKFVLQPFFWIGSGPFGSKANLTVKGQKAAHAYYYKGSDGMDAWGFSWLGVKSKHRGKGYSKLLTEEVARDIKRQGGNEIWNQVVHKNSLGTNFSTKRDKLFKHFSKTDALRPVSKQRALRNIAYWRRGYDPKRFMLSHQYGRIRKAPLNTIKEMIREKSIWSDVSYPTSDIFRQTSLKGLRTAGKGITKPFRTFKNKVTIAAGAAAALGSAAYFLFRKKDRNGK